MMKYASLAILIFASIFLAAGKLDAESVDLGTASKVIVYPSVEVILNESIVIRLPEKRNKVAVTQSQIAEVIVVEPEQLLSKGKAVGTTSLVVWYQQKSCKE